jgi:uncharacterized protein YndB with AHSA1/START domain/DNA-binding transcriptional ArsR family regulator
MMDAIFRALSDPHRRRVLDLLRERDGQTLSELEERFPEFTRFGLMKHLKVLEDASLITTRKEGRFKYHYLNPIPLQQIADRWISSFAAPWARGISQLKWELEQGNAKMTAKPKHVFTTIIKTTPQALWDAVVDPAKTQLYFPNRPVRTGGKPGMAFDMLGPDGKVMVERKILEATPYTKLAVSFAAKWDASVESDAPSRVTYEIEQRGECCKLTVVHDEFEGETQTYRMAGDGWPATLSGLKTLLETGQPLNYNSRAA